MIRDCTSQRITHLLKKLDFEQRRFATLPGKDHLTAVLPFNVLAHMSFEDLVGDAELISGADKFLLVKVIAVRALQVADGSGRLHHRMITARGSAGSGPWRQRRNAIFLAKGIAVSATGLKAHESTRNLRAGHWLRVYCVAPARTVIQIILRCRIDPFPPEI